MLLRDKPFFSRNNVQYDEFFFSREMGKKLKMMIFGELHFFVDIFDKKIYHLKISSSLDKGKSTNFSASAFGTCR